MKDKDSQFLTKENIIYLVVHCSDTSDQDDLNALDIHKMHLGFDWDGIGYHKIIKRNGDIENGRPEFWVGAHTKGLNQNSLGVCLIGQTQFSQRQFNSLEIILKNWLLKYPNAKIVGHRNAIKTHKTCPNFNVENWSKERGFYD